MLKKSLILSILFLLFSCILLFSSPLISLGFGSISQFQYNPFSEDVPYAAVVDVHNWATGGELRAHLFGLKIDGYALIQQGEIIAVSEVGKPIFKDEIVQRVFGMISVGLSTEVATCTTLTFGVGATYGINVGPRFETTYWMGDESNTYVLEYWEDFFKQINLSYRLRLDFNLGGYSVGVHYQVPSSGFSYASREKDLLTPDWKGGRIGASFITSIF